MSGVKLLISSRAHPFAKLEFSELPESDLTAALLQRAGSLSLTSL